MTHRPSRAGRPGRGFTLIEMMVVVAIIAILSMIALPNYQAHVRRAKRAEAQAVLMEAAQFMQRYYSANDRYTATAGNAAIETEQKTVGANGVSMLPASLRQSPPSGTASNYTIAVFARDTPPGFTLKATRAGTMSADKCGTLVLNSLGARTIDSATATSGATAADCWK